MIDGGYAYGYLFISQNKFAEEVFIELLNAIKPSRILEIGTFHGGLTMMLRDIMDNIHLLDSAIRTYDIHDQEFLKPLINGRAIEVFTKNLFDAKYHDFADDISKNELYSFIQQQGTTLVLCDGGCKKCEFNLIAPMLKTNDIIMAHDYAPNEEYFNQYIKGKIWDWLEIQDSDINQCVIDHNLQPYLQSTAQKAAWCCKIKA